MKLNIMKHIKLWENFDEDIFKNMNRELSDEEKQADLDAEKADKTSMKDYHSHMINATGGTWLEAVQRRVKSVKNDIQSIMNSQGESTRDYVESAYEAIKDLREMGYEAKEYADNLDIELKKIANDRLHGGKKFY